MIRGIKLEGGRTRSANQNRFYASIISPMTGKTDDVDYCARPCTYFTVRDFDCARRKNRSTFIRIERNILYSCRFGCTTKKVRFFFFFWSPKLYTYILNIAFRSKTFRGKYRIKYDGRFTTESISENVANNGKSRKLVYAPNRNGGEREGGRKGLTLKAKCMRNRYLLFSNRIFSNGEKTY